MVRWPIERKGKWSHMREKKERRPRGEKSKTNFFANGSELKRAIVEKKHVILLVYKESFLNLEEPNPPLPNLAISLLQEFEDIFPEDMTSGLPLIQGIENQINFVPGAVIPNRPAYRNNLEKTNELQKQVEELMSKGM